MKPLDIAALTVEQVVQFIHQIPAGAIQSRINELTADQTIAVIAVLDEKHDKEWREKLRCAIKGLSEYPKLETAGKALSFRQAQEIFDAGFLADKNEFWKLSPLFVGMRHDVFTQFLRYADTAQMEIFKQEAITEPLQHHLTVLIHEILNQIPFQIHLITDLEHSISQLDVTDLRREDLALIMKGISQSHQYYEETAENINKLLSLAWNSSRLDLIEKLSQAKEVCQKLLFNVIGHPRSPEKSPTGLYAKLQERLNAVFGNPADPQDIEALSNDEPALEALVKFSVWYLQDYWELGLLPSIKDPLLFNRLTEMGGTEEAQNLKNELFIQARENLSRLHLNTVSDLKRLGIYSKKILAEYIADHQHLMAHSL